MMMVLRRFIAEHGQPARFISDRGSKLTAAKKEMEPDWIDLQKKMPNVEWLLSPTKGHWWNGQAEVFVHKTKRALELTIGENILTFGELLTFAKEVKAIINSHPIGPQSGEDPTTGPPLTPNHLFLAGRSTVETPQGDFQPTKLTKRFTFVQNLISEWWKKWYHLVFHSLSASYKWRNVTPNLRVGDVVLIYREGLKCGDYQLGKILEARKSEDGLVCKCLVEYVMGTVHKTVEKAVGSLVLIVPVNYQEEQSS
jgi:hypothetical protein